MKLNFNSREMLWKAIEYFNLYRFLIALLSVMLIWTGKLPEPLGSHNTLMFSIVAHLYLLLTLLSASLIKLQIPGYESQVTIHVLLDIAAISMMMYSSNGISSGFGMLLVITVIAGSILRADKIAVLFAATATLIVLGQESYMHLSGYLWSPNYTHAGLLGVTFFMTAFLGQFLATKVQKSEALAKQHAVDLEDLGVLNKYIVQRMRSGLLVLDDQYRIRLLNEAAELMLDINQTHDLQKSIPEFFSRLVEWDAGKGSQMIMFNPPNGHADLKISFTRLNPASKFGILIFLEDTAQIRQHAHNLKTASLGRLSASIAHEIRNPLAAISHANQLLSESNSLTEEHLQLTGMIKQHAARVNKIIENMMFISRNKLAIPEYIDLNQWLPDFISEFARQKQLQDSDVIIKAATSATPIRMDASQLHQAVWNISENAVRHSRLNNHPEQPLVEYHWGVHAKTERPYLDIVDHGPGIADSSVQQLFEAFFTTSPEGSGLGLYISRELCEANQASLVLNKNTARGCQFRINFSHSGKYEGSLL